jgi:hypothetical protein
VDRYSLKVIADQLNAAGIRAKQGGRWQCGQVDSLLASRHTAAVLAQTPASEDTSEAA